MSFGSMVWNLLLVFALLVVVVVVEVISPLYIFSFLNFVDQHNYDDDDELKENKLND